LPSLSLSLAGSEDFLISVRDEVTNKFKYKVPCTSTVIGFNIIRIGIARRRTAKLNAGPLARGK
jgi:hypothetical protein